MKPYPIPLFILVSFLSLIVFAQPLGNLSGTIKDPKGAVIAGAQVTVRNESTNETKNATTDAQGKFAIAGLAPGTYVVSVTRDGFKATEQKVVIEDKRTATAEIKLELAEVRSEITTSAISTIKPNTDPNYRALRDGKPNETYTVTNVTMKRDVGTFVLKSGRISFLPPVLGRTVIGVFVGEGEFTLEPYLFVERAHLKMVTEKETVNELFAQAVFTFTDETYEEIKKQGQSTGGDDPKLKDVLKDFQNRLRRNTDQPRSLVEYFMTGENAENIEAELLASLYNPKRAPMFNAYIFGRKHKDLRFLMRPQGALPQMLSPEEIALVNVDTLGKEEGVWYLSHFKHEFDKGGASSDEDKSYVNAEHYKIETVIKGEKLTAVSELNFTATVEGERVFRFALLPSLRVTRVLWDEKTEVHYIQEDRKSDSAFYAILPEALVKGRKYKVTVEYQGDKVVHDAGGGNFAVEARTSWYPSVNAFNDRATFDLTFKTSKQYMLVGVGKKMKEWQDGDFTASQWVSETPLAVAGFNFGRFKTQELTDEQTKYKVEGYAVPDMPDYLRNTGIGGMAPSALIGRSLVEAQNSMRIFTHYFGPLPYGRISITQQPQPNFGQSWPTLVYMPLLAYMDATQRWMLLGINNRLTEFIDEVNSHEVAHQWWGHIVGWSSYHDQWLSEGFAFFSAGLYLKLTEQKPDKYLNYWRHAQEGIVKKNEFGLRATDVAPVWMGLRGGYHKYPDAYQWLAYRKGGFVLHMLRQMMWDEKEGDKAFIAMMRDFVKTHYNQNASTESFKAVAEKHMTPRMDLAGNKKLDWFFLQWVYSKEVPRYKLEYSLTPQSDGKTLLTFTLTQSDVSPGFGMPVPVYLDFDGKMVRMGDIPMVGSSTSQEYKVPLPQKPKRVLINYHYDVLASASESVEKK
jgi:hypothetical protein